MRAEEATTADWTAGARELWRVTDERWVGQVAFTPDGRHLATASGEWEFGDDRAYRWLPGAVRLLELESGSEQWRAPHEAGVRALAISGDGRFLISGCPDGVRLFETGNELWRGRAGALTPSVAFSPDGTRVAAGATDGKPALFEVQSGRELWVGELDAAVPTVAFDPRGNLAIGVMDGTARLLDLGSGGDAWALDCGAPVPVIAVSPDGLHLAAAGEDGAVHVLDIDGGRELWRAEHDTSQEAAVAFSPDGRSLATNGEDGVAQLFDVAGGGQLWRVEHGDDFGGDVVFSPDGRCIAVGGHEAQLLEAESGRCLWKGSGTARSLAFSPDNRHLAVADQRARSVRLFAPEQAATEPDPTRGAWPASERGEPAQASSEAGSSAAPGSDPQVEEKLATIGATASVEPWAVEEVRKLLEPGEMPLGMLMCAGGLKSMVETGSLAESLQSMLGEDTVLVATDRRVAWVSPKYRESGSGSIPLSELREVSVPRAFFFGKGQLTLELSGGGQVPLGISKKRKSEAKALAAALAEHLSAG